MIQTTTNLASTGTLGVGWGQGGSTSFAKLLLLSKVNAPWADIDALVEKCFGLLPESTCTCSRELDQLDYYIKSKFSVLVCWSPFAKRPCCVLHRGENVFICLLPCLIKQYRAACSVTNFCDWALHVFLPVFSTTETLIGIYRDILPHIYSNTCRSLILQKF